MTPSFIINLTIIIELIMQLRKFLDQINYVRRCGDGGAPKLESRMDNLKSPNIFGVYFLYRRRLLLYLRLNNINTLMKLLTFRLYDSYLFLIPTCLGSQDFYDRKCDRIAFKYHFLILICSIRQASFP